MTARKPSRKSEPAVSATPAAPAAELPLTEEPIAATLSSPQAGPPAKKRAPKKTPATGSAAAP
ncbi:NADH-quinone oxidoreductase subunit I, partial [Streptomyces sp. SID7909]|nr:NADH-quinone oxidoreductase subunit I [Streptomyces sp. SID7909]